MKRLFLLVLLLLAFPDVCSAQFVQSSSGSKIITTSGKALQVGGATSYVGPVATATMIPNTISVTAAKSMMTRKAHYIRSGTTRIKFCYADWYVSAITNNTFGTELGVGNAISVTPWLEYPQGTYNALTFSASSPGIITDATTRCTDFLNITPGNGTLIYSWTLVSGSGGNNFPYYSTSFVGSPLWYNGGGAEKANAGTSGVPTTPGAMTDNFSGRQGYWPVAIVGDTTQPTFCFIGDSRTSGVDDVADSGYDLGNLARSVGPTHAYLNMGVSGDRMAGYYFSHTLRDALIATSGCTNIINELGVNEYNQQSSTTANWQTQNQFLTAHFYNAFPTIPYTRTTMEPWTTSTDSWKTAAGQTGTAYNANITTSNNWVRSSSDGVPFVELSTPVSSAVDSGLWATNGYSQTYVFQGGHETAAGNKLIASSGNINPAALARNALVPVSYPSLTMTGFTPSYTTGPFAGTQAAVFATGNILKSYGLSPGVPPATIECEVYISAFPSSTAFPCALGSQLSIVTGTGYLGVKTGDGTQTSGTTAVTTAGWHHLELDMGTQTSGGNIYYTVFLDGTQVAQYNFNTASTQWANQNGVVAGSSQFAGRVAEVAVWNTVRHTSNFTPPSTPYVGNEAGLVALWHFNGDLVGIRGPAGN